jgi:tellurite resistance-related uncharacterized protein
MKKLPADVAAYRRTEVFTRDSVPPGLLKNHSTAEGIWGLIRVERGRLEYTIGEDEVRVLTPEKRGVVEPATVHHVRPLGEVRFFVEFYRKE